MVLMTTYWCWRSNWIYRNDYFNVDQSFGLRTDGFFEKTNGSVNTQYSIYFEASDELNYRGSRGQSQ